MSGQLEVIVAEALDRLSRDQPTWRRSTVSWTFAGVRIVTLEGEISELHVGLKDTMNQLLPQEPRRQDSSRAARASRSGQVG
jgi:hypothetical protein